MVEIEVTCPSCFEPITTTVDTSQGSFETIEDCQVCCRPMEIAVVCRPGEILSISAEPG